MPHPPEKGIDVPLPLDEGLLQVISLTPHLLAPLVKFVHLAPDCLPHVHSGAAPETATHAAHSCQDQVTRGGMATRGGVVSRGAWRAGVCGKHVNMNVNVRSTLEDEEVTSQPLPLNQENFIVPGTMHTLKSLK